jgi:hypothetical protein
MHRTSLRTLCALLVFWAFLQGIASVEFLAAGPPGQGPTWQTDYAEAVAAATQQGKMLLVYFVHPERKSLHEFFESDILTDAAVCAKSQSHVRLRLPVDATIVVQGERVPLLRHAAFHGMRGNEGLAVIDFAHRDAPYYGCVVGAYPFSATHCYSARQTAVILDLPAGTPQERAEVFAARMAALPPRGGAQPAVANQGQPKADAATAELQWLSDYSEARHIAERQGDMLLVFFSDAKDPQCSRFEAETLADSGVRGKMRDYVRLRLPCDAKIKVDGKEVTLLAHPAFSEMLGRPGIALVDFAHKNADYFGCVVSTFPLTGNLHYTPQRMAVILDLPPGTLTQRTLIYAVRIHPERPASTTGRADPYLLEEAEQHSQYQAEIRVQGHHRWESRFHRINARLPRGCSASEVCAESWPGENLVEAAIECVRCWRTSDGHWSAVRAQNQVFGYDMKRGPNGIWYATGIFGRG